jgi:hypothetical protein
MTPPEIEADWLQDMLHDVADRLRRGSEDLATCAGQLERIVADLRSPEEAAMRPRPEDANLAPDANRSESLSLHIAVTIPRHPQT